MTVDPESPRREPPPGETEPSFKSISRDHELSLVAGGALYRLLVRSHLLRPPTELVKRRIGVAILVTWLPLLLLSTLAPQPTDDVVSFFTDIEVNVRLLVSLPLLIAADLIVHSRLGHSADQFLERQIISAEHTPAFRAAARRAERMRDALFTELVILGVVIAIGRWSWLETAAITRETWYGFREAGTFHLTYAGYWYTFISLPVYQFIVLRWYVRLLIWFVFLWRLTRLPLRLLASHPDRAAGLAFVGQASLAFAPVLFAQGALFAGIIANHILHGGRSLQEYAMTIGIAVVGVLVCNLGPLLMFLPKLANAKRLGRLEYGLLAETYIREFENKWIRQSEPNTERLLGTQDIQALADLINSHASVDAMRPFPISADVPLKLALATVAPILPLVLTVLSVRELIQLLAKIFF